MANTKNSALTELNAVPDDDDLLYMVDTSDTTMASSGTSKKNKAKYFLRTNGTANTLGANINANGYSVIGAGSISAAVVYAGTISNFYLSHFSSDPLINFDGNDFFTYTRSENALKTYIGAVNRFTISGDGVIVPGSVTQTTLGYTNVRMGVLSTPRVVFDYAGGTVWQIDNDGTNFRWFTPGVVRMSLSSSGDLAVSGKVAIGHATPSYPLHVSAASGVQAYINATSGQYTQLTLGNGGADKLSVGWDNTAGYGYIASDSAFIIMDGGRVNFTNEIGGAWANAPSFNTGWGNYGGGEQVAQYKKVGDLVFLRGLVARSSGSQTTICTLPSGYRPPAYTRFRQSSNTGDGQIEVAPTGEIVFAAGGAGWISLDRIIFSTV